MEKNNFMKFLFIFLVFKFQTLKIQKMPISNAVSQELVSKIIGYQMNKGFFQNTTPNLPQRIVILGESNTNMQGSVAFDEATEILTAQAAAATFGNGSPVHMIMNILRPISGSGVGGIPTVVYSQEQAVGATSKILEITATGVATANATHVLKIAGRTSVNGVGYNFTVNTGDTAGDIHQKIEDAINAVYGSPVSATSDDYSTLVESKWKGLSANGITIEIDTNGNAAGITYDVAQTQAAAGTPSVASALADFGNTWNTIVINSYGFVTTVTDALESVNGRPDVDSPTGRYSGLIFKPFFAFTGYTSLSLTAATAFTDARKEDVTICVCPAPGSLGLAFEAAANYAYLEAPKAQNNPHLDISGQYLPDMPTPVSIGDMDNYLTRQATLVKGCSTVQLNAGRYQVMDFVTTYHPDGETPPNYRYVRTLVQGFNVKFTQVLLMALYVADKAIAKDSDVVTAPNVIKPSGVKQILISMANDLAKRAIITDPEFMIAGIQVGINATNPDRIDISFPYKNSGYTRVLSTTVDAGFNFNS